MTGQNTVLGAYGPLRPEEQAELRRKDVDDGNDPECALAFRPVPPVRTRERLPRGRPTPPG